MKDSFNDSTEGLGPAISKEWVPPCPTPAAILTVGPGPGPQPGLIGSKTWPDDPGPWILDPV